MSVLDQLRESLSDFSRNERHVADYILSNPQEMRSLSGEALAAICGVSRSTVLRLCQKLGYQGYAEFKYALQHETEHPAQTRPADALPTQNVLTYYCSGMLIKNGNNGERKEKCRFADRRFNSKGNFIICYSIIFRPAIAAVLQCGRCMGCRKFCR